MGNDPTTGSDSPGDAPDDAAVTTDEQVPLFDAVGELLPPVVSAPPAARAARPAGANDR